MIKCEARGRPGLSRQRAAMLRNVGSGPGLVSTAHTQCMQVVNIPVPPFGVAPVTQTGKVDLGRQASFGAPWQVAARSAHPQAPVGTIVAGADNSGEACTPHDSNHDHQQGSSPGNVWAGPQPELEPPSKAKRSNTRGPSFRPWPWFLTHSAQAEGAGSPAIVQCNMCTVVLRGRETNRAKCEAHAVRWLASMHSQAFPSVWIRGHAGHAAPHFAVPSQGP